MVVRDWSERKWLLIFIDVELIFFWVKAQKTSWTLHFEHTIPCKQKHHLKDQSNTCGYVVARYSFSKNCHWKPHKICGNQKEKKTYYSNFKRDFRSKFLLMLRFLQYDEHYLVIVESWDWFIIYLVLSYFVFSNFHSCACHKVMPCLWSARFPRTYLCLCNFLRFQLFLLSAVSSAGKTLSSSYHHVIL